MLSRIPYPLQLGTSCAIQYMKEFLQTTNLHTYLRCERTLAQILRSTVTSLLSTRSTSDTGRGSKNQDPKVCWRRELPGEAYLYLVLTS